MAAHSPDDAFLSPAAGLLNGCSPPPDDEWFKRIEPLGEHVAVLDVAGHLQIFTTQIQTPAGSLRFFVAQDLAVAGDWIHLVGENGYASVDASDRTTPHTVGQLNLPGRAIAVQGDRVFVGTQEGLHVLDVSDPEVPHALGSIATDAPIDAIAIARDHAYIAAGETIRAIAIQDPSALSETARTASPLRARRLLAAGEHLFSVDAGGVSIFALLEGEVAPSPTATPTPTQTPLGGTPSTPFATATATADPDVTFRAFLPMGMR